MTRIICIWLLSAVVLMSKTSVDSSLYSSEDMAYLKDTLYTIKPYFIEVNLLTQMGYLYSRDSVKEFPVSSGSKRFKDGVDTKEGLFVIQSMMPKWYSRQFDSTLMLNWMGFNYGIGFHALIGNSYYRHLGKRKSSHGCIRISRETAAELYSKIDFGTPVLVHSGSTAVWVAFADSAAPGKYKYLTSDKIIERLKYRLKYLYDGNYFLTDREKLLIDDNNVNHPGLTIGEQNHIPRKQITAPVSLYINSSTPLHKGLTEIKLSAVKKDYSNYLKLASVYVPVYRIK